MDSDRENLFQILTARTTGTKDEALEFVQAEAVFSHLAALWPREFAAT